MLFSRLATGRLLKPERAPLSYTVCAGQDIEAEMRRAGVVGAARATSQHTPRTRPPFTDRRRRLRCGSPRPSLAGVMARSPGLFFLWVELPTRSWA